MEKLISVVGLFVMVGFAVLLCKGEHRKHISLKLVSVGIGLQLFFAFMILKTPVKHVFYYANIAVNKTLDFTLEGSRFIFGDLLNVEKFGFVFAFQVLPTIIFFSSLMTVLYHLGIMQAIINVIAKVMAFAMGTSGSESLSAAANIFVGQTEAPLVIKPYVSKMTQSELMAIMTGGMATVAGGVMAAYVGMLRANFPDIAGHLIAASVMSAPAALVIAKIMIPETEESMTGGGNVKLKVEKLDANVIDAAARGAGEGLTLSLNVAAMLLAFIALIAMINYCFKMTGVAIGFEQLSLEWLFGQLFSPLAFIMGVPWAEAPQIGTLLGQKIVINEFVAYAELGKMIDPSVGGGLSYRSKVIATYALCGFANFSSIAIQIGGIGTIAPERRSDLSRLGIKAMIAGALAAFMTATVAGILV